MKLNVGVAGDRLRMVGVWLTAFFLVLAAGILLYVAGQDSLITATSGNSASSPWSAEGLFDSAQGRLRGYRDADKSGSQIFLANMPLNFEANQGQTDSQVKFLARGGGYTLFLTQDAAVLKLSSGVGRRSSAKHSAFSAQHSGATTSVVHMKLVGANTRAAVSGSDQLPSRSNYFIGNDPSKWQRNVPQFARVRYEQIYPGIDLVYYGNQGRLEYDFEVAPGADPQQIGLQLQGAQNLVVNAKGELVAGTGAGRIQLHAPEVYQRVGNQKRTVAGKFVLSADNKVRFALGEYDRGRELVIDPVLSYVAYFGGDQNEGCGFVLGTQVPGCPSIAVDASFNRYLALTTTSANFPITPNGRYQALNGTAADVFIAKFNASGVVQSETYLGGTLVDYPVGIKVDPTTGAVYVAGNTTSTDFPTVNGFQSASLNTTTNHGFVSVFSNNLTALNYSTYLSGTGTDTAAGLAIDNAAGAYVTGHTTSQEVGTGFPSTSNAFQPSPAVANLSQFFFSKINTAATGVSSMVYSSYLGGSTGGAGQTVGGGIATDSAGNVYVTGGTDFTNMPVLNAYQATSRGGFDAFVGKFNVNQSGAAGRQYLTYLGGTGDDVAYGIAIDTSGNAYITGGTTSTDFTLPTGTTPFQNANKGAGDAFVGKIGSAGNTLTYFSYLGGSGADVGYAIVADSNQGAHITGVTASSTDFPQVPAGASTYGGGASDAFVALIQTSLASGTTGGYSRWLGGNNTDDATGIAVDTNASTYVAGETNSTSGLASGSLLGGSDAFVATVSVPVALTMNAPAVSPNPAAIGNQVTFTYTIKNNQADIASNIVFQDTLPVSGATFASATATPGACATVVNGSVTCPIGSLAPGGTATVKINLTPTVASPLSNGAMLLPPNSGSSSATVPVTDFAVGISPSTAAVVAGNTATYQVQVGDPGGQTSFFPNAVSLSCSAGVPTGAACTFSTNPVTLTSTSPISSTLTLTTTARPVTTGRLQRLRTWYAAILPIGGLTFLGFGIGTGRRRRWLIGIFAVLVFGVAGLQLACSSGSGTTTPPAGTPAGTYPITLTGTSGAASHAVRMTLVVQ